LLVAAKRIWFRRLGKGCAALALLGLLGVVVTAIVGHRWAEARRAELAEGSRVVTTPLGDVEVTEHGEGAAILVMHGTPGGYDQSAATARAMVDADDYRIIAASRPGYLRTPLESGVSPAQQADLFAALLEELDVARVAVVGASGGGPAALQFAQRHPDRCWALVLLAGVSNSIDEPEPPLPIRAVSAFVGTDMGGMIFSSNPAVLLGPERAEREEMVAIAQSFVPEGPRRAGVENDEAEFLHMGPVPTSAIRCPSLIVHGTDDPAVPFEQSQALAERIGGDAELLAIEGGRHLSTLDAEATTRIREFLATYQADEIQQPSR